MKPFFEIFEEVEAARSKKKRVEILKENDSERLRLVLDYAFNKNITWEVKEVPPFKTTPDNETATVNRLYQKAPKLIYLTNISPNAGDERVVKKILLEILESVHPKDAAIVYGLVTTGEIPYDRLTKEIVEEAFPEITASWE